MGQRLTRRQLLRHSTGTAALITTVATLGGVHAFGAESPKSVRLGIIGCGGIMGYHLKGLVSRRDAVSIDWLCDVDPQQIERMATIISSDFQKTLPLRTGHFEDVVGDKNVDACIIATPHHWHAPIAIRAMQAGKDVYIEKPISHVYNEGHLIIAAAKKYG